MRDVGKNIKTLRMQKNMTQDELAQQLFVTRQTVSNYENGNSRPDVDMLLQIAGVFGVDVNAVIYGPQIDPEEKRKRRRAVILFATSALAGVILAVVTAAVIRSIDRYAYTHYIYYYSARVLLNSWLKPAWLLLMGWATMHALCVFCGTKTLNPPASRCILWSVIALLAAYIVLILPHSVWLAWNDLQVIYKHKNGVLGTHSGSFSIFPAWDQLAFVVMGFAKPGNLAQTVLSFAGYLSLPFGALLRLCRKTTRK